MHLQIIKISIAILVATILTSAPAMAQVKIVTTIKPLHSIIANITKDINEPHLLIKTNSSPHDYNLKPSGVLALHQADIVIWIGPGLESRLAKTIRNLRASTSIVTLLQSKKLNLLELRERDHHGHQHDDDHESHSEDHKTLVDPHIWLSIKNAKTISKIVFDAVSIRDPKNSSRYQENLESFTQSLNNMKNYISNQLQSLRKQPYLVYHDAFQYFENEFGLRSERAIISNSEHNPGAKRISFLRKYIAQNKIGCVFSEPQVNRKNVRLIIGNSSAQSIQLDAIGAAIPAGINLYSTLVKKLSDDLSSCLRR